MRSCYRAIRLPFVCLWAILLLLPFGTLATVPPGTPLSYFAIFYNNLLEFSTCGTMTINGLVHCNTNIYVGAGTGPSFLLTFNSTVTTSGTISAPTNNGARWTNGQGWKTIFQEAPSNLTGVAKILLTATTTNLHSMIDVPPTNDAATLSGLSRLYNQAQVVLIVSNTFSTNTIVSIKVQSAPSPSDIPGVDPTPLVTLYTNPSPASLAINLPFLSLTNRFYDMRENSTNLTTQIDVGQYAQWLTNSLGPVVAKFPPSGAYGYPTILFVADNRRTNGANKLAVVRLTNGIAPPSNGGLGFSVATPNPLYVWGNYNCTNPAYLGTTNTSASTLCAFFCDALTVLSTNWSDSNSLHNSFSTSSGLWAASPTNTVNAAIVAGIVPSTGTDQFHFSGGVHNFPRLLEELEQ